MADEISVIDLANQYGKRKQSIFKILKRIGIEATKRQGANSRGLILPRFPGHPVKRLNS